MTKPDPIFAGVGEMERLAAALDWTSSPLGPPDSWPMALRMAVRMMLGSRHPMAVWWGPQLVNFHNDACAALLGPRHSAAFGQPAGQAWQESWNVLGPAAAAMLRGGSPSWHERLPFTIERGGMPEERYVTISQSPILAEDDTVGGVFCACTDETASVLATRRLRTLREVEATWGAVDVGRQCQRAAEALAWNARDVTFVLAYLLDEDGLHARRAAIAGIAENHPAAIARVRLFGAPPEDPWRLGDVGKRGASIDVDLRVAGPLPGGAWTQPSRAARVVPLHRQGVSRPAGFLVVGLAPCVALTDEYRGFVDLAGSHIATAVASVAAQQHEKARGEELSQLDRAKTAFFSNVSHEFRTPLTLIRGPVEEILAGDAGEPTPGMRSRVEMVRRNALRLQKLVNALLEFARVEAGRVQVYFEPIELAGFTREVASAFGSAMTRAGLRYVIDCPPLAAPVYVDRDLWEKIVLNLISNAIKYTHAGEVSVVVREDADHVSLAVIDTGVGIASEHLPRVFDRFNRVHGTAGRTEEGSGIGLALVQEFAKLHGGRAAVESRVGGGSTFTVTIPKGRAHLPESRVLPAQATAAAPTVASSAYVEETFRWLPEVPEAPPRQSAFVSDATMPPISRRRQGRERILVVDDNADMRQYLQRLLARYYEVGVARDGQEAYGAALATMPDLVVTDAAMPRMDGFALIRKLKEAPRTSGIPVILLSAPVGEDASVEALAAGASDHLAKPFGARELLTRVAARLEIRRVSRESEKRIAQAEQRLRLATEAAGIYSWELDIEARTLVHSGNSAVQLGFPLPQRFDEMLALVHELDRPALREAFERAMREGRQFDAEFRFVHPGTGEEVWQLLHGLLLELGPRNGRRLIGISQDITARKRAEAILRQDELNAHFVNQLDVLLAPLTDPQEMLTLCVRRLGEYLGVDRCCVSEVREDLLDIYPGDWTGPGLASLAGIHPVHELVPRHYAAHLAAGDAVAIADVTVDEHYERIREGVARMAVRSFIAVPRHGNGRWEGTLAVTRATAWEWRAEEVQLVRDVTTRLWPSLQRATYERSLRQSEARFRAMADSSPVMIWVTDAQGQTTFVNTTYLDFFGVSRDQVAGFDWQSVVHPEDREAYAQAFSAAVRDKTHFHFRARVKRRDGRWRWIESRGNPRLDEQGRVLEFIGSAPDVTEFYESQELMRQADRRKDEFLAMLAHELRNPLAPIMNATRALRRLEWGEPEAVGMRDMIERQAEQLTRLVDDLLDVSRITRGIIVLRKENVELLTIVARALEMCRPLLDARRHDLQVSFPKQSVRVEGDTARLAQVVSNLVNNAAKYTDEGGKLRLEVEEQGRHVMLRVSDNGMGIPTEELPHVFDLFSQGERTLDRAQGGLGIGLTVVKQLVQMHGGTVEARSPGAGQGSTFTVCLPLAHAVYEHARVPPVANPPAHKRLKVMVVDDNIDSATSMALLLKLDGYDVKLSHDGPEAIRVAQEFQPAMMLLDIGLPTLSGYEVAKALRSDAATREIVLVAMTGYGQAEDRARTRAAGFDHHLTKPVDETLLTQLLDSLALAS